jgi:hypothetical protein
VTGDIGLIGSIELAGLEPFDGVSDGARTAGDHSDASRRERLVRIRAAVSGKDELDVLGRHELARLNTGATAERGVGVLDGFDFHGVRINDQEVRTTAEAGIDFYIQRWATGRDCDFHQTSSFLRDFLLR